MEIKFKPGDRFTRADGAEIQVRERTESGAGRYTVAVIKDAFVTFFHLHGNEIHDLIAAGTWVPVKINEVDTEAKPESKLPFQIGQWFKNIIDKAYYQVIKQVESGKYLIGMKTGDAFLFDHWDVEKISKAITDRYWKPLNEQDPAPNPFAEEKRIMAEFEAKFQEGTSDVPPKSEPQTEPTNPDYYGGADNPYEAIKVIEAWGLGFILGNVVKYIARAGKKGAALPDMIKARDYITMEIKRLEKTK
jgi:hypothetical protein